MSDLTLQIAASGIDAEEAELNTAANNLANVSTAGYAREVVNQANIEASGTDGTGSGVLITSVTSDGSQLYDQLNELAQGQLSASNESVSVQDLAQNAFPTSTGTGLSTQLSTLWTDFSTLATEPSSSAAQQSVVQAAGAVASTLNSTSSQLSTVGTELQGDLGGPNSGYVGQANQLINQIAQINGQLAGLSTGSSSSGGLNVNSLTDEQRADAATLAGLVGSTSAISSSGTMTVSVAGIQLVSGSVATTLDTTGTAGAGDLAVETTDGNVVPAGGTVGSLLTGVNTTIPNYVSSLDSIADSLATSLNTLQAGGVSASGVPGPDASSAAGYTGTTLPSIFVNDGSSTDYTTGSGSAATISVNPTLSANPSLVATAAGTATAGEATIDPTTAQAMAALGSSSSGPDEMFQSLVALVGSQTSEATDNQTSAQALSDSTSAEQSSEEGVDTNDETVNMLAAQQNYQALASVISGTTSALESLLTAVD